MSAVESKVDALKELRVRRDVIEAAMRKIRLGADIDMRFKRFFWRDMVIAHGWGHIKSTPLPEGIERDFYSYLAEKLRGVRKTIEQAEKHLESLSVPVVNPESETN